MEKMDGVELSRAELAPDQVIGVLDLLLSEMATAYAEGWVHADMSEYNVFVDESGVTIFDWPQAVPTDHENAAELLRRDVENLLAYFHRKYPSETPNLDPETVADRLRADEFESVTAV